MCSIFILDNNKVNLSVKMLNLIVIIIPFFLSCQETKEIKKYNVSMSDSEWKNVLPETSYNILRKTLPNIKSNQKGTDICIENVAIGFLKRYKCIRVHLFYVGF